MSLSLRVEALRNKNSKKIFVLVDNSQINKMTIINPEGKLLTVPEGLFEPPFSVTAEKFPETFTPAQITTIEKELKRGRPSRASNSPTTRRRISKKKEAPKFGLGAEWEASKLTFYKHKIEPLQETQSFKINLENVGIFEIIKADFCRVFNEVVISTSYWKEGAYTYGDLPEKARKFIKSA